MIARGLLLLLLANLAISSVTGRGRTSMLGWDDLYSRPRVHPDAVLAYGDDPLQHVEVWEPGSPGPHPVVLMIHGGCWQTDIAQADIMHWAADDLRRRGFAVWNVEYRGIDRPGGGYPGTFRDIAAAADLLRRQGPAHHLDLGRVVVLGHSAGGHLALWLAGSGGLPVVSPLHRAASLPILAAISLGGLPDLEAASVAPGDTCGSVAVPMLTGHKSLDRRDVFADTSPARLPQPTMPIMLVNGARDAIAPPASAAAYAARVRNPLIRTIVVPDEGHVEEIAPGSRSWTIVANRLRHLLARR